MGTVRTATYESADKLRRKYVPDPAADLLDDLRAGLAAASSDQERQALVDAAYAAAAGLVPAGSDRANESNHDPAEELIASIDALANPPAPVVFYRTQAGQNGFEASVPVTVESEIASNPDFKMVVETASQASSTAEAVELFAAAMASGHFDDVATDLLWTLADGLVDDGTVPTHAQVDRQEHEAKIAEAEAAEAETNRRDAVPAHLATQFAELVAQAEADAAIEEAAT
jgi:hypothetical protein